MTATRIALVAVLVIGKLICQTAMNKVSAHNAWLQPPAMAAAALGVLALVIVGTTLLNRPLPLITSDVAAIVAVVAIIVVNVTLTRIHGLA